MSDTKHASVCVHCALNVTIFIFWTESRRDKNLQYIYIYILLIAKPRFGIFTFSCQFINHIYSNIHK